MHSQCKHINLGLKGNRARGLPFGSAGKETVCNAGDLGSIPGLGRSPGEGKGYPLSILAWRIPWTGEPGGLHSCQCKRCKRRGFNPWIRMIS